MKKLIYSMFSLLLFVLISPMVGHAEESPIHLFLNSKPLVAEVSPRIVNDITLVPVRIISEELAAKVSWSEKERKVTVEKLGMKIQLYPDIKQAIVNEKMELLEVAPTIVAGNTLLPLRFIADKLGLKTNWDDLTHSVYLYKNETELAGKDAFSAIIETPNKGIAAGSIVPLTNDKQPDAKSPVPDPKLPQSDAKLPVPDPKLPQTDAKSPVPDPKLPQPDAKSPVPDPKLPQGDAKLPLPDPKLPQPDTKSPVPDPKLPQPDAKLPLPDPKQTVPDVKPVASNVKVSASPITEIQSIQTVNDQLLIQANGELKPYLFNLADQDRLVLDLPYSVLSKQIIGTGTPVKGEIATQHPLIAKISYSLFSSETSTIRIVIDLKKKIEYNLIENKPAKQVGLSIKSMRYKVVIDAGHGDHDSGAVSVTGRFEKDFTLAMVTKINKLLEKEPLIQTVLTRDDDTFVTLDDRVADANNIHANVFVSIHGNKFKPDVRGVETYYYNDFSLPLATIMHRNLLTATGFPDRSVRKNNFRVIKYTNMPAILCEIGYLSNKVEEAEMYKEEAQDRYAASIVAGIKEFLQIK